MRLSLHITHHGTLPVEIPQNLRDMSEQNMKQAHAEYENLTDFVTKAKGFQYLLPSFVLNREDQITQLYSIDLHAFGRAGSKLLEAGYLLPRFLQIKF